MLQFRLRTLLAAVTLLAVICAVLSQWASLPEIIRLGIALAVLTSMLVGLALAVVWFKRRADFAGEEGRHSLQTLLAMTSVALGIVWLFWACIIVILFVVEIDAARQ